MTILLLASGFRYVARSSQNLGDVAQQQATIDRLRQRFPRARILAVANSLNDVASVPGLDMAYAPVRYLLGGGGLLGASKRLRAAGRAGLLLWNAQRVRSGRQPLGLGSVGEEALRTIAGADGLVLSGAGAFNDAFGGSVGAVWALILRLAAALGKPVVVSGQQIGPFRKWLPEKIARWGLRPVGFVGVRDPISLAEAARLGIPESRLGLTGDDAWHLRPCAISEVEVLMRDSNLSLPFVAAQVRFDKATGWTRELAPALGAIIDQVCALSGAPALFLRTHYASDSDDLDAARLVQQTLKAKGVLLEPELNPSMTKAMIAMSSAAVGVSYHFCVFSCSSNRPTIGLYMSDYMKQKMVGLSMLCPNHMIDVELAGANSLRTGAEQIAYFLRRSTLETDASLHPSPQWDSDAALDRLESLLNGRV